MGLEPTTSTLRVRRATHCATPHLVVSIFKQLMFFSRSNGIFQWERLMQLYMHLLSAKRNVKIYLNMIQHQQSVHVTDAMLLK